MNQRLLSTLISKSPLIFFELDLQGDLTFLNESWSEHTGNCLSESLGKRFATFLDEVGQIKLAQIIADPLAEAQHVFISRTNNIGNNILLEIFLTFDAELDRFGGYMSKQPEDKGEAHQRILAHFNESQKASKTGSWIYTFADHKLWISDECYRLFELDKGKVIQSIVQLPGISKSEADKMMRYVREVMEERKTLHYNYELIKQDGKKCLMRSSISPELDENEKLIAIKGIIQDITDSIALKEKLLESESRFRMLAEFSQDVISTFDPDLRLTYITPSVKRLLGYTQEEMLKMQYSGFLTEESLEAVMKMHQSRTSYDQILTGEFEFIRKNGTRFWGGIVSSGMRNEEGEFIGYILTTRDIDEKIKFSQKLKESQSKLQEAQNIARMGSYEFNYISRKAVWSEQMYEILCLPHTFEPKADTLNQLLHPDDKARVEEKFFCYPENGEVNHLDFRICLPDGNIIYVTGMNKTYLDKMGNPIRAVGIIQNITERKLAEQKIEIQNAELIKVNQEMDHLIYSSSHDLRSPLASALGLLQIIRLENDQNKKSAYLELMHKCLIRLDTFTREILDLFKNARSEPAIEAIDLHQIVDEILEDHQYMEGAGVIHLEKKVEVSGNVYSDRKRLINIISNLFSNAIRYHNYNQLHPFVRIEASLLPEDQLEIIISDNGQGIQAEHQERIFDMFYRANPEKKGSGLGLYLVKETVEKLGGKISLRSEYRNGSEFKVLIPLHKIPSS